MVGNNSLNIVENKYKFSQRNVRDLITYLGSLFDYEIYIGDRLHKKVGEQADVKIKILLNDNDDDFCLTTISATKSAWLSMKKLDKACA